MSRRVLVTRDKNIEGNPLPCPQAANSLLDIISNIIQQDKSGFMALCERVERTKETWGSGKDYLKDMTNKGRMKDK